MTFLTPIAALIAAGITIPVLVAMYFLKRRRKLVAISSTLLWRKAIQDLQANAPFQRIRRNLLLLLQLLALAALLLAFAQPTMRGKVEKGQRTVIVIDRSASMNATDVSPSRLAKAREVALDLIDGVGDAAPRGGAAEGGGAMVISIAKRAQVVQPFTTDRSLLRRAVKSIQPTDQESRIGPALQLIEPFAVKSQDDTTPPMVVYVLSDGRMHDEAEKLTLRGTDVRFVSLGTAEPDNLAIVALSARRDLDDPQTAQVFVRLANYSRAQVDANVELTVDGDLVDLVGLSVAAMHQADGPDNVFAPGVESVQFNLPAPGSAFIEVTHDHEDDLSADNSGRLNLAAPAQRRVTLVTEGNAFLVRAIKAAGAGKVNIELPEAYENRHSTEKSPSDDEAVDVFVFDRYSPRRTPLVDSLYFGAAPAIDGLSLAADDTDSDVQHALLDWRPDHPVLRYVALDDLVLAGTGRLVLPDAARMLAVAESGPVMAAIEVDRRRHVVVGFDVLQTNWPMQVSFPVFVSNALQWLGSSWQAAASGGYRPGGVAVVPAQSDATLVAYRGPVSLSAQVNRQQAVLPMFTRVGTYYAREKTPEPWDRLPVNLIDMRESDLRPVDRLQIGTEAATSLRAGSAATRRQAWRWFIWPALALLMIEWIVYTRRMHL